MKTIREQLITSEAYGRAVDALIDALPDSAYDPCPCGCGMKMKFARNDFEAHENKFVKDYIAANN